MLLGAVGVCGSRLQPEVVKHTEAKRGFVLLPRRWLEERTFACAARFRRLARDYERLATMITGYHSLSEKRRAMADAARTVAKSNPSAPGEEIL
jgi:transposase